MRPDLNLASIALRVGCSPQHLSDILRGRRRITPKLAPRLAQALNLPQARIVETIASWAAQAEFTERRNGGKR